MYSARAPRTSRHFYPRPPRGGRPRDATTIANGMRNFYPRPPRGGRRWAIWMDALRTPFLSTPSARRATCTLSGHRGPPRYFYPRPPRGGRLNASGMSPHSSGFLSTPSARRATDNRRKTARKYQFLSTPSARRATNNGCSETPQQEISIHALREEGDSAYFQIVPSSSTFLSTPSARRATSLLQPQQTTSWYFYPRPPRGGRQQKRRKTSPLLFHYKTICTDLEELVQKHPKKQL